VLSPTSVWSRCSNRCSESGIECRRRRCSASVQRAATSKISEYVVHIGVCFFHIRCYKNIRTKNLLHLFRKQFINTGSCCVVDLEQWTGLKCASAGCLIYCRYTNLRGVTLSTGASI
jgi:hypothetical protein